MSWIFPIFHPWKVLLHHIWSVSPGEYDPAEIHNAGQLRRHMVRNAKMRRNLTNFSWVDLSLRMGYEDVFDKILMARLVCVCTWAGRWWASSCTSTACWMLLCRNRWQFRWKLCVVQIPWKQAVAHSSCSRWLSRWTTMWRCSTGRWKPNTTHPHLIMCTLRHVQCFNYIQCTTYYL